jgi:hypothetical protein
MNISGAQLFQNRPSGTTNTTAFTATQLTEFTRILVCNTTGSAVTFRLFHDDSGSTMDQSTALFYDVSIAANTTEDIISQVKDAGLSVAKDGTIGIRSSTADALNFTGYGTTWVGR